MELSSSRFKAVAVTAGSSLWFFIITSSIGIFSLELFAIFVIIAIAITQIFSIRLSKGLDTFAIANTKLFLGILYVVVSLYGILFSMLRIDFLRLKKQQNTYWLNIDDIKESRIYKQY